MIPALCVLWLAVWWFRPHRPYGADETRWLFYAHERGRHLWGVTAAALATLAVVIVLLLSRVPTVLNTDMARLRGDEVMGEYMWQLDDQNEWKMVRT